MSATNRVAKLEQENAQLCANVSSLNANLSALNAEYASLKQQLEWFKRQLFGSKSEKRLDIDPAVQGNLLAGLGVLTSPSIDTPTETITYQRRKKTRDAAVNDSGLRFDDSVPVQTIELSDPAIDCIPQDQREVIGEKISYRLAQRPGSYLILKYVRPVIKRKDTQAIMSACAPGNVLDKSSVDVSFLAGMLIDKFCYHLPLYRQHQRLAQCGIQVSRSSLTNWEIGRAHV